MATRHSDAHLNTEAVADLGRGRCSSTVMSLVEGGNPIDLVFRLLLNSINGIRNQYGGSARAHKADPDFYPLIERLPTNQASGGFALRVRKAYDRETIMLIVCAHIHRIIASRGRLVGTIL